MGSDFNKAVKNMQAMSARGFCAADMVQYYEKENPTDARLRMSMDVPYYVMTEAGQQYTSGFCVVKLSPDAKTHERTAYNCELYVYDDGNSGFVPRSNTGKPSYRNVAELDAAQNPLVNEKGDMVSLKTATEEIGRFGIIASEFPHVMYPDEYMEAQAGIRGRFNMEPPKIEDYQIYLDSIKNQMRTGIVFVGAVQTLKDLNKVQKDYEENWLNDASPAVATQEETYGQTY